MYSASHPVSTSMNGMGADMIDGSGTINPAELNTTGITVSLKSSDAHIARCAVYWRRAAVIDPSADRLPDISYVVAP